MKAIKYNPEKDTMIVRLRSNKNPHCVTIGGFQICSTDSGEVDSLTISSFMKELAEFKKNLHTVRLGGIWKGLEITESEINEIRKEMTDEFDKRW
jgi:hypothetical protein